MAAAAVVAGGRQARLEPVLQSVARARAMVSETVAERGLDDSTVSDAVLIVSELVTNAVLHARTPIDVGVLVEGASVHIEVRDGSDRPVLPPAPAPPPVPVTDLFDEPIPDDLDSLINALATTGRGMELVTKLAARWGVTAHVVGKTVWAEVGRLEPAGPALAPPAGPQEEVTGAITLVAVPVRLIAESERNFDDTIRELQFIGLADAADPAVAELARMASGVLDRVQGFRTRGQSALRSARERGDRLVDLYLPVPESVHEAISGLDGLLRSLGAARATGQLLIMAPSPEVTDFRLWYLDEVRRQLGGAPPRPCPFPAVPTAPERGPVGVRLSQRRAGLLDALKLELDGADDARSISEAGVRRVAADTGAAFATLMLLEADGINVSLGGRVGYAEDEQLGRRYPVAQDNPVSEVIRTATPMVLRTRQERLERYPKLPVSAVADSNPTTVYVPLGERAPAAGCLVVGFSRSRDFTGTDLAFLLQVGRAVLSRLEVVS